MVNRVEVAEAVAAKAAALALAPVCNPGATAKDRVVAAATR